MTITESLAILREARALSDSFEVELACSFTPLHLKNLLAAHLQQRVPKRRVVVAEGTFGDLVGTVERCTGSSALAIAMEWQDVDPRLQYREGGSWGNALSADILTTATAMLERLAGAISRLPEHVGVAISLPTLPLLPIFHPPSWQAGETELALSRELANFGLRVANRKHLSVVNTARLGESSPVASRLDLKSDLLIGFPYTLLHADQVAAALALALAPRQPLKGVITDLDNTLWSGLVGEAGPDAVRWDPASRYYLHGLFQKLLAALADEGTLVAIASKNDPAVASEALARPDMLIRREKMFPVEVHWAPKSESIARILKTWNISADSVAFIDDTPLELAEVASAHPGITCLPFPVGDYAGVWQLLRQLRDLCGKSQLSEEDTLRMASIRQGAQFQQQAADAGQRDDFLSTVNATIVFDFDSPPDNSRTLELVNKTNQFNLNGARFTAAEWQTKAERKGAFVATVKYQDKFGALGTIAVLQGAMSGGNLEIPTWVMSCRAFSRRIEHQTLKQLFDKFGPARVTFDFAATPKNGPLQEFFATILGRTPEAPFELTREDFERNCPALYHQVEEVSGVTVNG